MGRKQPYDGFVRIQLCQLGDTVTPELFVKAKLLHSNIYEIMRIAANKIPGWKFLDRGEPGICTLDESKQIRGPCQYHNDLTFDFYDCHSSTKEDLTQEEWKQFAKAIEPELKNILGFIPYIMYIRELSSDYV